MQFLPQNLPVSVVTGTIGQQGSAWTYWRSLQHSHRHASCPARNRRESCAKPKTEVWLCHWHTDTYKTCMQWRRAWGWGVDEAFQSTTSYWLQKIFL